MSTIKFYVLGHLEKRGDSMCVDVVLKDDAILPLYTSINEHYQFFGPHKYLHATKANIVMSESAGRLIRLTPKTKVSSFP